MRESATVGETWTNRDLPVLKAIVDIFEDTGRSRIRASDVARRTGFDADTVQRAIRALYTHPYLQEDGRSVAQGGMQVFVGAPTGEALRVVGNWPSPESIVERLVAALEQAAEDDGRGAEERSRLKQLAVGLSGAAYQVALNALGGAGGNMLSG